MGDNFEEKKPFKHAKFAALFLSIAATLAVGFLPGKARAFDAFCNTGYIFIFITFLLWSYSFLKHLPRLDYNRKHLFVILLCLTCVSIIFIVSPPRYKILNDEAQLMGVSHSMYYHKAIDVKKEGLFEQEPLPDEPIIDKRPLLYPFLVSIAHSVKGYSGRNGFVVNYISAILILFLFQHLIARYYGKKYSFFAILLFVANPSFAFWITSSGFETVNLLFLVLSFYAFDSLLKNKNLVNFNFFLLTLVLLSQTRYEAILAAFILFCFSLPTIYHNKIIYRANGLTIIIPLLALPIIWQRLTFLDPAKSEIDLYLSGESAFFNIDYLVVNFPNNIYAILGLNPDSGFNFLISLLSLLGLYHAIKKVRLLKHVEYCEKQLFLAGITIFTVLLVLISSHYFGDMTDPTLNRISIIFLPFMVFFAVHGIFFLAAETKLKSYKFIFTLLVFNVLFFLPVASHQNLLSYLPLSNEYSRVKEYLGHEFPSKNLLIITDRPNLYVIQGYGAKKFNFANEYKDYVKRFLSGHFEEIVFIQRYDKKKQGYTPATQLETEYKITEKTQFSLSVQEYLVISILASKPVDRKDEAIHEN